MTGCQCGLNMVLLNQDSDQVFHFETHPQLYPVVKHLVGGPVKIVLMKVDLLVMCVKSGQGAEGWSDDWGETRT